MADIPLSERPDESKTVNLERFIRINNNESENYTKLGKTSGISFASCVDKGLKYCKGFRERAKYYTLHVVAARNEPLWISEFYGDKIG